MKIIIPITEIENQSLEANEHIEIIFEPKIKRIVLIPGKIKKTSSEKDKQFLDFKLFYSKFRHILNKHNINIDEYKVIHIQLNKALSQLPPHNTMMPIKTYKKMNLDLVKLKSEIYQNINFNHIVNIKNENHLIENLHLIQNASFKDSWGFSPNSIKEIKNKIQSKNNIQGGVLFYKKSNKPEGYVWLTRNNEDNKTAHVSMIGTLPHSRGKGIAKKLLESSINFLIKNNYQNLILEVDNDNLSARNVYKKYGFKDIEESYWYEFSDKTFR